jgi:hypothetical protein
MVSPLGKGGVDSTNEIQCHSPQLGRPRVNRLLCFWCHHIFFPPVKSRTPSLLLTQLSSSDVSPDPSQNFLPHRRFRSLIGHTPLQEFSLLRTFRLGLFSVSRLRPEDIPFRLRSVEHFEGLDLFSIFRFFVASKAFSQPPPHTTFLRLHLQLQTWQHAKKEREAGKEPP